MNTSSSSNNKNNSSYNNSNSSYMNNSNSSSMDTTSNSYPLRRTFRHPSRVVGAADAGAVARPGPAVAVV